MEFSLHRVWLLCKKQWTENKIIYLLGLVLIAATFVGFLHPTNDKEGVTASVQGKLLSAGMVAAGCILTASILSRLNDRVKGIAALTLPASALEKMVVALLFSLVFLPISFLAVAYPVVILMHRLDVGLMGHINYLYQFGDFFTSGPGCYYVIIQAIALFLSVFYKRYAIVKTLSTIVMLSIAIVGLNDLIAHSMLTLPQGPPYINTPDALPREKWDPSTYLNGTVHKIYYDENGKMIIDRVVKSLVAGPIVSTPVFDRVKMNNVVSNYQEKIISEATRQQVPDGVPFTLNTYITLTKTQDLFFSILIYLSVPLLWLATWFRMRETQL